MVISQDHSVILITGGKVVSSPTEEKVMQIVSEQLSIPREDISRDSSFDADLKADSLDLVELVRREHSG